MPRETIVAFWRSQKTRGVNQNTYGFDKGATQAKIDARIKYLNKKRAGIKTTVRPHRIGGGRSKRPITLPPGFDK